MIKFFATYWRFGHSPVLIEEVEVTKETDKTIWMMEKQYGTDKKKERAVRITSMRGKIFDTWEEAKEHQLERARKSVAQAESSLMRVREELQYTENYTK